MTPKQRLFVKNYLVDLNATQAAIRAGYSAKTASSQGERLLRNVEVTKAIQKAMKDRAERLEITADRVLQEIAAVAYAKLTDVMEWGANGAGVKSSEDLPEHVKSAVSEVSESATKDGDILIKIKMHDKVSALDKLMRHLGQYKDKVDLTSGGEPFAPAIFQLPDNARDAT